MDGCFEEEDRGVRERGREKTVSISQKYVKDLDLVISVGPTNKPKKL